MAPREKNATRGSIDLTANALLKSLVANAPATRIQFQSSQLNVSAQLMSQIPAAPSPQRPSLLPMPETVPGQTRRGGAVSWQGADRIPWPTRLGRRHQPNHNPLQPPASRHLAVSAHVRCGKLNNSHRFNHSLAQWTLRPSSRDAMYPQAVCCVTPVPPIGAWRLLCDPGTIRGLGITVLHFGVHKGAALGQSG